MFDSKYLFADQLNNNTYGEDVSLSLSTYRLPNNVDYTDVNVQKDAQISSLLDYKDYDIETKRVLTELIINHCKLPHEIATEIIEFLPSQWPFIQFNPTWYDGKYSLIELILMVMNNIMHYALIAYVSIDHLWLIFMIGLPLIESVIIIYVYYSNIKYVKKNDLSKHALKVFGKLYSILEICCYLPFVVFLFIIHETSVVNGDIAVYLILFYFGGYAVMKIYQYIMYKTRYKISRFNHRYEASMYFDIYGMIIRSPILIIIHLLFECCILFIYGMIIRSPILIIIVSVTFYIGLIAIHKASTGYWFDHMRPGYVMIVYVQNICFGIFSIQLLFQKWDEYPKGYIIICIISTFLQSIYNKRRYFIDKYGLNGIGPRYVVIYLLTDVLMNVDIVSLSLYYIYTYSNDTWDVIWYLNLIFLIVAQIIKTIYLQYAVELYNKKDIEAHRYLNFVEWLIYPSVSSIWAMVYFFILYKTPHSAKSQFLFYFALISQGIGFICLMLVFCFSAAACFDYIDC